MKNKITRRGFLGFVGGLAASIFLVRKAEASDPVSKLQASLDAFNKKFAKTPPGNVTTFTDRFNEFQKDYPQQLLDSIDDFRDRGRCI